MKDIEHRWLLHLLWRLNVVDKNHPKFNKNELEDLKVPGSKLPLQNLLTFHQKATEEFKKAVANEPRLKKWIPWLKAFFVNDPGLKELTSWSEHHDNLCKLENTVEEFSKKLEAFPKEFRKVSCHLIDSSSPTLLDTALRWTLGRHQSSGWHPGL